LHRGVGCEQVIARKTPLVSREACAVPCAGGIEKFSRDLILQSVKSAQGKTPEVVVQ
jgi:hypothetical protein